MRLGPSSADRESDAARQTWASIIQKQGWCWWWETSCCYLSSWRWLPPSCPWTSSRTSLPLCSIFSQAAGSCDVPWPPKPCKLLTRGTTPPSPQWHCWRHVSVFNTMKLWLAGVSHDSPWGLPHMNWALLAFKEHYSAYPSHQLREYAQCSSSCSVVFGVWQKMFASLCSWDTQGRFFCMVMERAFLVSRMLPAVIPNPESGVNHHWLAI